MMAYMVMVRPGTLDRYTDSILISEENANLRADRLVEEFVRRGRAATLENGNDDWRAWVSACEIEDAALAPEKVNK